MTAYRETKNYAKFRHELLDLCPYMEEREVYRTWWMYQCHSDKGDSRWNVQQTPLRGVDSKYHYIYCTTTPSGQLYVGIHSTENLEDGYQGSGDAVRDCKDAGIELKTTTLEFFRTREEALAMERHVVNERFLVEYGVLNRTIGGDDTRHDDIANKRPVETLTKQVSVEMPFGDKVDVPVVDGSTIAPDIPAIPKKVATAKRQPTTKKCPKNWFTLERLTVPVGGQLKYIADESITATTLNEVDRIKVDGRSGTLKDMTNKIAGKQVANCLAYWSWNGKSLLDIKNEIIKKGG